MAEIIHRKAVELESKTGPELKLLVIRGLARVSSGDVLFSGFTSEAIERDNYVYLYKKICAVTGGAWDKALLEDEDFDNPLYYAEDTANQLGTSPAVGAYDSSLLQPSGENFDEYVATQGSKITEACLRVVVWDIKR